MKYGYFDDQAREYVITRPDTPLPWINYLGCEDYFGLISNTAGGYSFYRDARLRRITRYRYNNAPFDVGGRYIYLRDNASEKYWSPSWQPTQADLKDYTCRHGMGYTVIGATYDGIHAETRYFVPLGQNLEIWQLTVTNNRLEAADLSVFSSIEFCLWDGWDDQTNFQRNFSIGQVEVEGEVLYHKTEYRERRDHFAYFACSEPLAGFDTQRDTFLGTYRGWDRPLAVERGRSFNSEAHGWAVIGSHHVKVTLKPGESHEIRFVLGYHENPKDAKFDPPGSQTLNKRTVKPVIAKYTDKAHVDAAFADLQKYWESLLGVYQVQSPDEHANRMVNIWNAYQCMATFNMSRSASFYESGIGRGLGFRDSNQDLLGFVQMVPDRARQRLLDLAATMLPSGGAYHQYQPLTKRGNNDVGSNFNDDPHWMVIAVAAYIKETGDWSVLSEMVPYDNAPGSETTLYEHLERAIQYTLDRLGPHGLPLIGRADWNDCLNLNCYSDTPGQSFQTTTNKEGNTAESGFIAGLFVHSCKELAALVESAQSNTKGLTFKFQPEALRGLAEKMTQTIYKHAWDGEWFLRAYDDAGDKVGSKECAEGQIFIEPQGYNIIAGIGLENGYAQKALDSVKKRLATRHGIVLQQPAYSQYYLNLGEISSYPPGYKENAGIFCHNNPWVIIAETIVGNGDQALDYYLRICPSAREEISDIHRTEPYVYSQMIAGRDAPTHGEAKNSWLTGTASWNYFAITQAILGIRPAYDGLQIAPAIPLRWPGFTATRKYQGVTYHIEVERQGPGNTVSLTVDGKAIAGNVVPPPAAGTGVVKVKAVLS
ncbi:MAG: GH36-type glycosyl hydrolase domain-containing protein [Chloroflexota bacterium]